MGPVNCITVMPSIIIESTKGLELKLNYSGDGRARLEMMHIGAFPGNRCSRSNRVNFHGHAKC